MLGRRRDLMGQRFVRLEVLGFAGVGRRRRSLWHCRCDCGKVCVVFGDRLLAGDTKSCGCMKAQRMQPPGIAACNRLRQEYRSAARRHGRSFELTKTQFHDLTSSNCYYCDAPPSSRMEYKKCNGPYVYNGIDRADNTKGYTLDNARPCCKRCNYFKGALSEQDFYDLVKHASRIASHLGLSPD